MLTTLPRSGMIVCGNAYQRQPLAHATDGTAGGALPTPLTADANKADCTLPAIKRRQEKGQSISLEMTARLFPTPTAVNYGSNKSTSDGSATRHSLNSMAANNLWPTPSVKGNYNRKGASARSGDGLATAVNKWATPTARDYRYPGKSRLERTGDKAGDPLPQQIGGPLNPTWVEWLMGFPLGWTDLEDSATP